VHPENSGKTGYVHMIEMRIHENSVRPGEKCGLIPVAPQEVSQRVSADEHREHEGPTADGKNRTAG
jgi:hypothetical protein